MEVSTESRKIWRNLFSKLNKKNADFITLLPLLLEFDFLSSLYDQNKHHVETGMLTSKTTYTTKIKGKGSRFYYITLSFSKTRKLPSKTNYTTKIKACLEKD